MVDKKPKVLIVDDEQVVCNVLCNELSDQGYLCTTVLSGTDALTKLTKQDFDIVLLDLRLPGIPGMEVLRQTWSNQYGTATIIITAVNDVGTAVEAMKLGASDYVVKPFDLDRVNTSIRTALEAKKCLLERRDDETALCVGGEEEDKQAIGESFDEMNAIARGVEAMYESLTGYSDTVTRRTIDVARQLGIAEKEIQRWAAARAKLDSDRNILIKSSLDKLQRSALAQSIMGMTELYVHPPDSSESQN